MSANHSPIHYLSAAWVLPVIGRPIPSGVLVIESGRIQAIGQREDFPADAPIPAPVPGTLLTPGLVNTHLHLEQSFPQAIPHDPARPFIEWLKQVARTNMGHNNPAQKRERCETGGQELLQTGTTCVNDISSGPEALEVLDEAGLRGLVSVEWFHPGQDSVDIRSYLELYRQIAARYTRHPRLKAGLAPHTPYNFSPAAWQALLAEEPEAWIHTHVAEFEDEVRFLNGKPSGIPELHHLFLGRAFSPQGTAPSPVAYVAGHGLLNPRTLIAHAVHTDTVDRQRLADAGVTVAHCPRSNLALHGQTLRWADWADSGVPVGLGTDGRLSTENLDLRAEARLGMQLHGWDASQALRMMTLEGARALHLDTEIGALTPGRQADCVLWQAASPVQNNPAEHLLATDTYAIATWIAGTKRWSLVHEPV